jgi:hypothetical protein
MVSVMRRAAAFLALACASRAAAPLNTETLLEAIRDAENTPVHVIGTAGERGDWQTTEGVWRQYSSRPHAWASRHGEPYAAERRRVARAHVLWILARLARLGLPESARSVGLVWNAGYGTVRSGRRVLARHRDFADRVQNLYDDRAGLTSDAARVKSPARCLLLPTFNFSKSMPSFSSSFWMGQTRAATFTASTVNRRRRARISPAIWRGTA